ncbi:MAG: hypothetical protein ACK559_16990, partial [bacterium]
MGSRDGGGARPSAACQVSARRRLQDKQRSCKVPVKRTGARGAGRPLPPLRPRPRPRRAEKRPRLSPRRLPPSPPRADRAAPSPATPAGGRRRS